MVNDQTLLLLSNFYDRVRIYSDVQPPLAMMPLPRFLP